MSETKPVTIGGAIVEISMPYAEDHICNIAEAKALNQVRGENIANNCRKFVNDQKDDNGDLSNDALKAIATRVGDYDKNYEFTLASVGGGRKPKDPLDKMAHTIAREWVTGQLKASDKKVKDYTKEAMADMIAQVVEHPEIIKAAKARLKVQNNLSEIQLDSLAE